MDIKLTHDEHGDCVGKLRFSFVGAIPAAQLKIRKVLCNDLGPIIDSFESTDLTTIIGILACTRYKLRDWNVDFSGENKLKKALTALLDRYVGLVNCGDCGNWNPETEEEVIAARAALGNLSE